MSSEASSGGRGKRRRRLTPEQKWEAFLEVTSQELTQADTARKYGVDVSTIVRLRGDARDAALAAFAASKPGHQRDPRDAKIDELTHEIARLTEAIKEQAIELALLRGKSRWG